VFLSCLGVLCLLAKAMQRLTGDRRSLAAALEVDFSGLGGEFGRIRTLRAVPALKAVALLTVALSLAWCLLPAREVVAPPRDAFATFPLDLADAGVAGAGGSGGDWQGTPAALKPSIERILGADDYFSALYVRSGEAAPVDLFLSWYARQTAGNAVHSPEVCLPGAGWEIASLAVVPIEIAAGEGAGIRFAVNRAVIRKGTARQLVWYWFEGRGRRLTGDFAAKGWTLLDSLAEGRSDGGLVRVITPIGDGGEEAATPTTGGELQAGGVAAADTRLGRFLAASLGELSRFIPN
jgi:EpsI family protein